MKKVTLMLVVMALLIFAAIGVSAADPAEVPDVSADANGKYTVTYDEGTAGEMYGFVVIQGAADSADTSTGTIVYIDQQTADETGKVEFTTFGLLDLDPTAEGYSTVCTAFIGGTGLDTATAIAELTATPSQSGGGEDGSGVTVSGTITDTVAGHTKDATITLTPATGDPITGTATKDDSKTSTFSISDVPAGTYTVKISKNAYLNYIYTGVTVGAEALDLGATNISTLAGNVDNEGTINIYDLNPVLDNFNKSGAAITNVNANVDGEGAVNIYDLNPVLDSFNDGDVTVAYTPAA